MNDQVNEWSAKSSVSLGRFSIFKRAFVCTVEGREAIQRELALLSAEPRKLVKKLHKYRTSVFRVSRNFASWRFHQLGQMITGLDPLLRNELGDEVLAALGERLGFHYSLVTH